MKKKSKSILAVVVTIILLFVVIVTLMTNILFSNSDTPKLFGHYIYMMEWDTMEAEGEESTEADAESAEVATTSGTLDSESAAASIHQYTAVVCDAYDESDPIAKNNAVLCVLADDDTSSDIDSDRIAVRRIYSIEQDSSGVLLYYPTIMKTSEVGTEPAITVDNILGKCKYESSALYSFITFSTGAAGIILLLVLPCVILVVMLIVVIVRANGRVNDEYAFEENYDEVFREDSYDDDGYGEELGRSSPYRSVGHGTGSSSFEEKRSSIAENFERKAVNPNSPYQKARTMQFKAQRDVPIYTDPEDQIPVGETSGYGAPSAHTTPSMDTYTNPAPHREPISHAADTPIVPSAEPSSYRGSHEASSPTEARNLKSDRPSGTTTSSRTATPTSHVANPAKGKDKYDSATIDELLAMIEDEKNRLDS